MSYFAKNRTHIRLELESSRRSGLRECQLGAYWAVLAHFTSGSEPALISLPTGAGKTALMEILSFGFAARRVLVIEPTTILRDQAAEEFAGLTTLKKLGVVTGKLPGPACLSRQGQLNNKQEWQSLSQYDVVVGTPHTTSPEYPEVVAPPTDLFDLVFLDEAHHTPAPTWAALLSAFTRAKCILLTATPFRRDKRRLQAPLIYSYPISRALQSNVYRPVKYHPVSAQNPAALDRALCRTAKRILAAETKLGNNSKLIVRTDRVQDGGKLVKLYNGNGISVEQVDYTKSLLENQVTINKVKQGTLSGIVCVGMVGEGLDLPILKIAVLHHAPRSFPFTLQFVGRVARFVRSQIGDAHLIASPDEVRGEVRRLFREDADWRKLIPQLVDKILGKVAALRHFRSSSPYGSLDIDPLDLKPFHSVRAYIAKPSFVTLDKDIQFEGDIYTSFTELDSSGRTLVLVTETERTPPWARETAITQTEFDLHVYHYHRAAKVLFEYTTSETIASLILDQLVTGEFEVLPANDLLKAMKGADSGDYLMVGLKNATGSGPSNPSYKTLMGSQVQAAVRPSDARIFAPGHALAWISDSETRGIASNQGRIWSMQRKHLPQFIDWCASIGGQLAKEKGLPGLPQIDFLAHPSEVSKLRQRPLAVLMDDLLLSAILDFRVTDADGHTDMADRQPAIEIETFDEDTGELICRFEFSSNKTPIVIRYAASEQRVWQSTDSSRSCHIRTELSENEIFDDDLERFLQRFSPILVCPDSGVIIGSTLWLPSLAPGPVPSSSVIPKQWGNCDIENEVGPARRRRPNVQQWIQRELMATTSRTAILIKDHGSGELADFIVIEPDRKPKTITFYHCKASGGRVPSVRVDDFYEVLQQACRSVQWSTSPYIMRTILDQTSPPRRSPVLKGGRNDVVALERQFRSNEWKYSVVAVQPGCDCGEAIKSKKVYGLIVAAYQWHLDANAEFSLWGS